MSFDTLRMLAKHAAHRTAPENYTTENVDAAFAGELKKFCTNINEFMKNRYDLYQIIIENVDDIVPQKVIDALSVVAEIKVVPQGQRTVFKKSVGKNRARKFLTQVGLSGVYETFRLDKATFEVTPIAHGGAVTIDFERMLDGEESLAEVMDVITVGLEDSVFGEVQKALKAAMTAKGHLETNVKSDTSFNSANFDKLVTIAKTYGGGSAVILAPPEFVDAMGIPAMVPGSVNYQGVYHPQDIDDVHRTGHIKWYKGCPIVEIPQSFTDETNQKTWIDPQMAYILPAGKSKVIKVVFEGQTQIYDRQNRDNSLEVNVYRKLGTAILTYNDWCIYQNTGITQTMENPYGTD
jgi:hypothetical protein